MSLDSGLLWAFFIVFVRCSALMLSSPIFGSQTTPVHIRVMTTLALSGALVFALHPVPPHVPVGMGEMLLTLANEAASGLLLGAFVSMTMMAVQFAGSFLDLHVGLGMSQVMNPVTGVPSSIMTQFKAMLALIIFVGIQGHHFVIHAFVSSYETMPTLGVATVGPIRDSLLSLVGEMSVLALQIAAPVAAVGLIVDTAMGVVNRAVPQMPVFLVGLPVKIAASMLALSLALPALVIGVQSGLDSTADALARAMRKPTVAAPPGGP